MTATPMTETDALDAATATMNATRHALRNARAKADAALAERDVAHQAYIAAFSAYEALWEAADAPPARL